MRDSMTKIEWINAQQDLIHKADEKLLIKIYRFCKKHYEFFLGLFIALIIFIIYLK